MAGPLDGVKILEFTEIIAGPFGGMMLSDMGADVIKVEPPWGEPWRFTREFIPNESLTYMALNRGKRSLPLDLTTKEGREIVYKLVPGMDVVIINARPDVPYKLGINYELLSDINPQLIYCENTAFGSKGPDSSRPGYDIVVQAMTGLIASEGNLLDGVPQQIRSTPLVDFASGVTIAWAICAALYHRERSGEGQKIETSLLASSLGFQTMRFTEVESEDKERRAELIAELPNLKRSGVSYDELDEHYRTQLGPWLPSNIYYGTFRARDGALAVGCLSDPLRKRLLKVLELEDIRFEPDYDPMSAEAKVFSEELLEKAEKIFSQKSVNEWIVLLDQAGVPAGPVRFLEELLDEEQVVANDLVVELEHSLAGTLRMVGPIVKMSETPLTAKSASPTLGEHTNEILGQLGYSTEEIQRLRDGEVTR